MEELRDEVVRLRGVNRDTLKCVRALEEKMTEEQGNMLAKALGAVLVRVGVIRPDASLTGPELLAAADNYVTGSEQSFSCEGYDCEDTSGGRLTSDGRRV